MSFLFFQILLSCDQDIQQRREKFVKLCVFYGFNPEANCFGNTKEAIDNREFFLIIK